MSNLSSKTVGNRCAKFIGSAFIRLILETGNYDVTNFDALTDEGTLENLLGLDPNRHKLIHCDIANASAILSLLHSDTNAIVNFAAESHVDRSIASAGEFLPTNIIGTQVLLDAARASRGDASYRFRATK